VVEAEASRSQVLPPSLVANTAELSPFVVDSSAINVPSSEFAKVIELGLVAPPGRVLFAQDFPASLEYGTKSYRASPISRSQMYLVPTETIPTICVSVTASATKIGDHRSPASVDTKIALKFSTMIDLGPATSTSLTCNASALASANVGPVACLPMEATFGNTDPLAKADV
jgi:hypothetical protein